MCWREHPTCARRPFIRSASTCGASSASWSFQDVYGEDWLVRCRSYLSVRFQHCPSFYNRPNAERS